EEYRDERGHEMYVLNRAKPVLPPPPVPGQQSLLQSSESLQGQGVLTPDSESVKMIKNFAVKSGGSLSIPCIYDHKYNSNRKYWCKGYYWSSCEIVAYTNTRGRISVTDHPTQNMFTVELNSLQDSDSGYYWCAVEIGDHSVPDDKDFLYLSVSADPAVSVRNSRVSGQEGGSVSVQCLYSAGYKNKQKQWCRFKDWSCYTVGRTATSQNSAVQISDNAKGSVSVEMSGLQKSDAGWYWFSAGDVGVTVHLTVTERPSTTTAAVVTEKTSVHHTTSDLITTSALKSIKLSNSTVTNNAETTAADVNGSGFKNRLIWVPLTVVLGLLLILVTVITYIWRKNCNENHTEARGHISNTAVHTTPLANNSVVYSAVNYEMKKVYAATTAVTTEKTSISHTTSGLITTSALKSIRLSNSTVMNNAETTAADINGPGFNTRPSWVLLAVVLGLLLILVTVITCMLRKKCR
ncbi:hypothetical protein NFI96_028288, partial [Prochilodus magdalenae]